MYSRFNDRIVMYMHMWHKLRHDDDDEQTKGAKECIGLTIDLLQLRHNDELRRSCDAAVKSNDWAGAMRAILDVMEAGDDADTTYNYFQYR
eukprot:CAMPEP_0116025854 /NCGR_PEP_ID=MMETSP0321-20121206/13387_1 /TAXON_ID=163516 /ORGANISM="Leptocylindrus danicus var. danicus, Strain B650" /LENGTH=90 /DNA_ID=CAMNT_0003498309 /DNA_START=1 /DNA_END=273 /DNA_ORIENTATION=-